VPLRVSIEFAFRPQFLLSRWLPTVHEKRYHWYHSFFIDWRGLLNLVWRVRVAFEFESESPHNFNNIQGSRWHVLQCFRCSAAWTARERHGAFRSNPTAPVCRLWCRPVFLSHQQDHRAANQNCSRLEQSTSSSCLIAKRQTNLRRWRRQVAGRSWSGSAGLSLVSAAILPLILTILDSYLIEDIRETAGLLSICFRRMSEIWQARIASPGQFLVSHWILSGRLVQLIRSSAFTSVPSHLAGFARRFSCKRC